ncbi:hypothetical protein LPJ70_003418, partial [Coemansia sp. RSA 2708]
HGDGYGCRPGCRCAGGRSRGARCDGGGGVWRGAGDPGPPRAGRAVHVPSSVPYCDATARSGGTRRRPAQRCAHWPAQLYRRLAEPGGHSRGADTSKHL